jgi:hypothetical protein
MNDPARTDGILAQGKALVRAIEAPSTIELRAPFEWMLAKALLADS